MKIHRLVLFLISIQFSGEVSKAEVQDKLKWSIYQSDFGFSIEYPTDWRIINKTSRPARQNSAVQFASNLSSSQVAEFSVGIYAICNEPGASLNSCGILPRKYETSTKGSFNGLPAIKFSQKLAKGEGIRSEGFKFKDKSGRIFLINFGEGMLGKSEKTNWISRPIFDHMINSFRIEGKAKKTKPNM